MIKNSKYGYLVPVLFLLVTCTKETAIPVKVDFATEVENNDYSVPVRVKITNLTQDADTYNWTFEGGSPSTSTDKNPGTIAYAESGEYTIRLDASNRDGSKANKEIQIKIDAEIMIGFEAVIQKDNFSPVEVHIVNTTKGANTFYWIFEGGDPSFSTAQEPGKVLFKDEGEHKITLTAGNGKEVYNMAKTITVAPNLKAAFDLDVAFEDDDFQVPVTMTMVNNSISGVNYEWMFNGAVPASSTEENPTITIYEPGIHTLQLKTDNGKETQTVSKEITVFPNTNLRVFNNVQLGINTAHNSNTVGAFFSTKTREVYAKEDLPLQDGSILDIAFFGLDANFLFNRFISPDQVQHFTFDAIANASETKFINLQESCDCMASLSISEFDAMEDNTLFQTMEIEETIGGIQDFDNSIVPRIVLFETGDGRKGAIKIKEFIQAGTSSYIVVDIKVQKQ
ncbi:PKD domain-containing protein [Flagellimonas onchidii]|uniref:PKD domain-containing protein n=1 Tax=Flagellimonas onchidii TaxID=2562684 RepID=UPI0010A68D6E|nr:PKD domain-containing protein [Allomuricauda onchidii]